MHPGQLQRREGAIYPICAETPHRLTVLNCTFSLPEITTIHEVLRHYPRRHADYFNSLFRKIALIKLERQMNDGRKLSHANIVKINKIQIVVSAHIVTD